ncbi:hypothetical protein [Stenotrophomonas phage vB_SmeS_BUCT700]|uniref:Uncharacterized protein n=1 Tax=Stenotrophomonas phage vB_SmeS_BUCT700 TaxID=2924895 RepID=A0AAE9K683_9CAUD|nr:hypothetical protein [Stenotrophomonas phage vB_SmeS_BUCT700]
MAQVGITYTTTAFGSIRGHHLILRSKPYAYLFLWLTEQLLGILGCGFIQLGITNLTGCTLSCVTSVSYSGCCTFTDRISLHLCCLLRITATEDAFDSGQQSHIIALLLMDYSNYT